MKAAPSRERGPSRWGRLVRWGLSLLFVAVVVWKAPLGQALGLVRGLSFAALAGAVLCTLLCPVVASFRWKRVLAYGGVHQTLTDLVNDTLVASAYNVLLPSQVGGDFVRAWRCGKRLERQDAGHLAWSTVLFERVMAMLSMAMVALVGLLGWLWKGSATGVLAEVTAHGNARLWWVTIAVFVLAALAMALLSKPFHYAARWLSNRAPKLARLGASIAQDLEGSLAGLGSRAETLLWSVVYQFMSMMVLVSVVLSWGDMAGVWAVLAGVPVVLVVALVPVSAGGLGVRESLFVLVLGQLGVDADKALALALVWLMSSLLLGIPGAVVVGFEARKGSPSRERDG